VLLGVCLGVSVGEGVWLCVWVLVVGVYMGMCGCVFECMDVGMGEFVGVCLCGCLGV